jgi:hypothetical protein
MYRYKIAGCKWNCNTLFQDRKYITGCKLFYGPRFDCWSIRPTMAFDEFVDAGRRRCWSY